MPISLLVRQISTNFKEKQREGINSVVCYLNNSDQHHIFVTRAKSITCFLAVPSRPEISEVNLGQANHKKCRKTDRCLKILCLIEKLKKKYKNVHIILFI